MKTATDFECDGVSIYLKASLTDYGRSPHTCVDFQEIALLNSIFLIKCKHCCINLNSNIFKCTLNPHAKERFLVYHEETFIKQTFSISL